MLYFTNGCQNNYELTIDNAYFVVNAEGGYDLYLEDQLIGIFFEPFDEALHDLKIYHTKEEIYRE